MTELHDERRENSTGDEGHHRGAQPAHRSGEPSIPPPLGSQRANLARNHVVWISPNGEAQPRPAG